MTNLIALGSFIVLRQLAPMEIIGIGAVPKRYQQTSTAPRYLHVAACAIIEIRKGQD